MIAQTCSINHHNMDAFMPKNYTSVRFVAYEIDTSPAIKMGKPTYLGEQNIDSDIQSRCKIMARAMSIAANKVPGSVNTLNVFMAPEFYFRGPKGAYPVEKISSIMDTLRKEASKSIYKDWLFVFGTALGFMEDLLSTEVFNVAMLQKGGNAEEDRQYDKIIYKEYVSHIDFIRSSTQDWSIAGNRLVSINGGISWIEPTLGSRDIGVFTSSSKQSTVGPGKESQKVGYDGNGVFKIDNITFAVEVCLDHYKGRLKASPQKNEDDPILVHLIPSAGMNIVYNNVVADAWKKGAVFNVDGMGTGAHSDAQEVNPFGLTPITLAGTHNIATDMSSTEKITDLYSFKSTGTIKWFAKHNFS